MQIPPWRTIALLRLSRASPPPVFPAKAGTQRNHHSHTNQGRQQPSPPSPPSSFPRLPLVIPAREPRNHHSHTNQGRQQPPPPRRPPSPFPRPPSSFPRRREPSATITRIPTKVANNPHPPSPPLPPVVPSSFPRRRRLVERAARSVLRGRVRRNPAERMELVMFGELSAATRSRRIPTKVANNPVTPPSRGRRPLPPRSRASPSSFPRRREPSADHHDLIAEGDRDRASTSTSLLVSISGLVATGA